MPNPQTNVRLSNTGRKLLEQLALAYGISHTDVVEIALREYAKSVGLWDVQVPKEKPGPKYPPRDRSK